MNRALRAQSAAFIRPKISINFLTKGVHDGAKRAHLSYLAGRTEQEGAVRLPSRRAKDVCSMCVRVVESESVCVTQHGVATRSPATRHPPLRAPRSR